MNATFLQIEINILQNIFAFLVSKAKILNFYHNFSLMCISVIVHRKSNTKFRYTNIKFKKNISKIFILHSLLNITDSKSGFTDSLFYFTES